MVDHDLIARACRLTKLWYSGTHAEWTDGEHYYGQDDNPALHALLVLRLQVLTGACIDYFPEDEGWLVMIGAEATEGIETLIDIIRVLVDALEGEG